MKIEHLPITPLMALGIALCAAVEAAPAGRRAPARTAPFQVSPAATQALIDALAGPDGEYAAHATYQAVLDKFGEVLPFANIIQAEERHIAVLEGQLKKYGIALPKNKYLGKVEAPASLAAAAAEGVRAEQKNIAMFDELLEEVRNYPDLTQVFSNLQRASRDHHLPAFQSLADGARTVASSSSNPAGNTGFGRGRGICGQCPGCMGPGGGGRFGRGWNSQR